MNLYIFSSENRKNIEIGVKNRLWAVTNIDPKTMKVRFTKSRAMVPGSKGLLYCSEPRGKCFTVPFTTESQPVSADHVICGVWDKTWALPFKIKPLGPAFRSEPLETARRDWILFKEVSNVTQVTPLGGKYAFNACPIPDAAWEQIVDRLGYKEDEQRA